MVVSVDEIQIKASSSGLPTSQELATHKLGLFTKPAGAGAGSFTQLQVSIYWHGGGDEMQNKAEAQQAWLQLAAGTTALAQLSLAIKSSIDKLECQI